MKKAVLLLAMIGLILASCGGAPTPEGTWQLDSVSGETLTEAEKSMTVTYNSDGTCESSRGDETKTGTWEMAEDGKSMSMTIDGHDEQMDNLEITSDQMTFMDGDDKITLKKLN